MEDLVAVAEEVAVEEGGGRSCWIRVLMTEHGANEGQGSRNGKNADPAHGLGVEA